MQVGLKLEGGERVEQRAFPPWCRIFRKQFLDPLRQARVPSHDLGIGVRGQTPGRRADAVIHQDGRVKQCRGLGCRERVADERRDEMVSGPHITEPPQVRDGDLILRLTPYRRRHVVAEQLLHLPDPERQVPLGVLMEGCIPETSGEIDEVAPAERP